jgi:hypothetical protein
MNTKDKSSEKVLSEPLQQTDVLVAQLHYTSKVL